MNNADKDYLYENAPLIEVIAEVRWQLIPLAALPGGSVDPIYSHYKEKLLAAFAEKGFATIENIAPPQIPIELLGGQPLTRMRRRPNELPLFQLGPGVFTCNITPPYNGWNDFARSIATGADVLMKVVPILGGEHAPIIRLELRYIDAFGSRHGCLNPVEFLESNLGIRTKFNSDFCTRFSKKMHQSGQIAFDVSPSSERAFVIEYGPAQVKSEDVLLVNLVVNSRGAVGSLELHSIEEWMRESHKILKSGFEAMINAALRDKIGPKKEIED